MNQVEEFCIQYPMDTVMQQKIANEFALVGCVGFPNCAGCIDGLLI